MAKNKSRHATTTKSNVQSTVETKNEHIETSKQEVSNMSKEELQKYIKSSITVEYSYSSECKRSAVTKTMIIEDIYKTFITNPKSFISIKSSRDLEILKETFNNENLLIDYKPIIPSVKDKFIEFLINNTKFSKARLNK
jgi:hypothetical protein